MTKDEHFFNAVLHIHHSSLLFPSSSFKVKRLTLSQYVSVGHCISAVQAWESKATPGTAELLQATPGTATPGTARLDLLEVFSMEGCTPETHTLRSCCYNCACCIWPRSNRSFILEA